MQTTILADPTALTPGAVGFTGLHRVIVAVLTVIGSTDTGPYTS